MVLPSKNSFQLPSSCRCTRSPPHKLSSALVSSTDQAEPAQSIDQCRFNVTRPFPSCSIKHGGWVWVRVTAPSDRTNKFLASTGAGEWYQDVCSDAAPVVALANLWPMLPPTLISPGGNSHSEIIGYGIYYRTVNLLDRQKNQLTFSTNL